MYVSIDNSARDTFQHRPRLFNVKLAVNIIY